MKRPAADPHRHPTPVASANTERHRRLRFNALQSPRPVRIVAKDHRPCPFCGGPLWLVALMYQAVWNDSIEMGSATVSVAAIGVPPMASACGDAKPFGAMSVRSIWSAGRRPVRARPRDPQNELNRSGLGLLRNSVPAASSRRFSFHSANGPPESLASGERIHRWVIIRAWRGGRRSLRFSAKRPGAAGFLVRLHSNIEAA